ncbi:MAG TPA: MFS transporter [Pyrinomonadaceae bacterium]
MTYRQLLKENADLRRLWLGQVVSEIGDWLSSVAVLALAIQLAGEGREGLAVAIYAIARHLPLFVFGPLAGVLADRLDRRRVMIRADLLRALLALGFLLANRWASLNAIYLIGASLFAVSAFFNAAKRAAIPNLVRGASALLTANSLSASTTAATIAVGSALGGLIATFAGRNTVFLLNAATFIFSAEMIRRIISRTQRREDVEKKGKQASAASLRGESGTAGPNGKPEVAESGSTVSPGVSRAPTRLNIGLVVRRALDDFREGLRYVRGSRVLSAVFVVAAGWGLGNGVARALYSVFGARLGQSAVAGLVQRPTDFGISVLFVAMGLGGVIGAPIARRFNAGSGHALGSRMGRSIVFDGCGLALFSLMPNLWGAALVLIAREINFAIWWTAQQTLIMSRTEDRFGGRVFASYETLTTLMMLFAMLASGAAADTYGIKPVAAAGGLVIIISGLLWFMLRRRDRSTATHAQRV